MNAPIALRLEPRRQVPAWWAVAVPALSIVAALVITALFLWAVGQPPIDAIRSIVSGGFFGRYELTDTLATATPLIMTGLGAAVAFRVNLFNIGGEGQFYLGALGASWAAFAFAENIASPVDWIAMILAGAFFGALAISIPALGRIRWGASEIVSTLMMNYIALSVLEYLVREHRTMFRDPDSPTFPKGRPIDMDTRLPNLGDYAVGLGLIVAVLIAALVWFVQRRTRRGFELSVIADSPRAAAYAGISWTRQAWAVMLASGALAGIGGALEVSGRLGSTDPQSISSPGYGYAGIVVAALVRYDPALVIVGAILVAGLRTGGANLQVATDGVPVSVSALLTGAVLLAAIGGEVFRRNRLVVVRR